jgi:hypothetical protein
VIGDGKRLFPEPAKVRLVGTKTQRSGVVVLTYASLTERGQVLDSRWSTLPVVERSGTGVTILCASARAQAHPPDESGETMV